MIQATISKAITYYLGSSPKPYLIPSPDGFVDTGCEYWELPPQKDEDKPTLLRYQEITSQIIQLVKENKDDPKINLMSKEANELLRGVPVTRKYGMSIVSPNDVLSLDKTKGIRKEWWEFHSKFSNQGICLFQGYKSGVPSVIADTLIVMPNQDQYEFLRINRTRGNNHPVETEQIIAALKKLEHEFGVLVIYASMDLVEFIFNKPIDAKNTARIRQRLQRLCPGAEELTSSIRLGRITLWWD
jgi:Domain of unknown function (DUF4253)